MKELELEMMPLQETLDVFNELIGAVEAGGQPKPRGYEKIVAYRDKLQKHLESQPS
jgi:hypothetical protein